MRKNFAYWGAAGVRGHYTHNANAYQKTRLAVENLNAALLVPVGAKDTIPEDFSNYEHIVEVPLSSFGRCVFRGKLRVIAYAYSVAKWCRKNDRTLLFPISNEITMIGAILASVFVPIWIFCWDPPGVTIRNKKDVFSRQRCRIMDWLMERAVSRSRGMILNLHEDFVSRFSAKCRSKIHVFRNGTDIEHNHLCVRDVKHERLRLAVNSTFAVEKGCWEYVAVFERLWHKNKNATLVWIGHGDCEKVKAQLLADGIPESAFTLGRFPLDESLRLLASASVAVCLYQDIPSWRWNFVLKAPEFLSMGIPIVAYRLPGIASYMKDGFNGLLIDGQNLDAACCAVEDLMTDVTKLDMMVANAHDSAEEYDWTKINGSIAELLMGK